MFIMLICMFIIIYRQLVLKMRKVERELYLVIKALEDDKEGDEGNGEQADKEDERFNL